MLAPRTEPQAEDTNEYTVSLHSLRAPKLSWAVCAAVTGQGGQGGGLYTWSLFYFSGADGLSPIMLHLRACKLVWNVPLPSGLQKEEKAADEGTQGTNGNSSFSLPAHPRDGPASFWTFPEL